MPRFEATLRTAVVVTEVLALATLLAKKTGGDTSKDDPRNKPVRVRGTRGKGLLSTSPLFRQRVANADASQNDENRDRRSGT